MRRRADKRVSAEQLRLAAEGRTRTSGRALRGGEAQALLHELEVQQIELEMQNEQLRHTQEELESSRDRYAALYDRAPVGYLTLDQAGAIVECNLTAAELLGRDRRGLLGLELQSFLSPRDAEAVHRQRMALLRRGGKQSCEVDLQHADGRRVRVRLDSVAETVGAAGLSPNIHVALIDVTELRGTQADLQVSEARFRQIAANIQDAFYLRELDGGLSYVSPAYEAIWGRPASELTGQRDGWMDSVAEEDRERVKQAWARVAAGTPISEEYRIVRPDGTSRWVLSRGFPIIADDGAVLGSVGVVRDVTHERRLEQALRQAQKMEAVGTLASGVAHHLRNVLQAILYFLDIMRRNAAAGESIADPLERTRTVTKRGAVLIEQLVTFARKQDAIRLSPVRLDDALCEAAELIKPVVGEAIRVEVNAGAPNGIVMADPVQIEQVLLNLASNARDAMPRGGTLAITSTEAVLDAQSARAHGMSPGRHVVVTVKDTGEGMDAATKARVFEPFFTTKEVGKGTGLGLSTVFGLVQHFGGSIHVDSAPGAGTSFTIVLPALRGELSPELHR